jgi:hypothetical protein
VVVAIVASSGDEGGSSGANGGAGAAATAEQDRLRKELEGRIERGEQITPETVEDLSRRMKGRAPEGTDVAGASRAFQTLYGYLLSGNVPAAIAMAPDSVVTLLAEAQGISEMQVRQQAAYNYSQATLVLTPTMVTESTVPVTRDWVLIRYSFTNRQNGMRMVFAASSIREDGVWKSILH